VQYAKQVGGTTQLDAQRQFIPLMVNAAGVMLHLCASLMFVPGYLKLRYGRTRVMWRCTSAKFSDCLLAQYNLTFFGLLIIIFTLPPLRHQRHPNQIADDLAGAVVWCPA
jgi:preprotein translocase subunit SecY